MIKKLIIVTATFILIVASSITIYATTNSVTLETDKTNLEIGQTFSIKLKATSPDGINGIFTTYNYDTKKLEIVEKKLIDDNFVDLSGSEINEIAIMFNPKDISSFEKVTEANLYEITFKVKENAKGKTKITFSETDLSTLAQTNSEHKVNVDEITIKINNDNGIINLKTIIIIVILLMIVIFVVKNNKKKNKKKK